MMRRIVKRNAKTIGGFVKFANHAKHWVVPFVVRVCFFALCRKIFGFDRNVVNVARGNPRKLGGFGKDVVGVLRKLQFTVFTRAPGEALGDARKVEINFATPRDNIDGNFLSLLKRE